MGWAVSLFCYPVDPSSVSQSNLMLHHSHNLCGGDKGGKSLSRCKISFSHLNSMNILPQSPNPTVQLYIFQYVLFFNVLKFP